MQVTVKWPDGRKISNGGYTEDEARALANFLWSAGADVQVTCECAQCETCTDRATFENC